MDSNNNRKCDCSSEETVWVVVIILYDTKFISLFLRYKNIVGLENKFRREDQMGFFSSIYN